MMSSVSDFRVWAEIDLDALASNFQWIRSEIGGKKKIISIVKADAYGHGLKQIVNHLAQNGSHMIGVANLKEAADARAAGGTLPILMLSACFGKDEFQTLCQEKIAATLSSFEEARELASVAEKLRQSARVHLKIDTGMGRLGVHPKHADSLAMFIFQHPQLHLEGVYTHLSSSEEDAYFTRNQLDAFHKCMNKIRARGLPVPMIHVMNSAGVIYENEIVGNCVRLGLIIYGIVPLGDRHIRAKGLHHLRPVMSLKSRISFLKDVSTGTAVGYGQREVCDRPTRLAIVCAGYGDGIIREGSKEVLVRGVRCPIKGRITMDQMMIDVSFLPTLQRGEEVVLIGNQGRESLSANEIARRSHTIPWEVLTSITQRVPRIYKSVKKV